MSNIRRWYLYIVCAISLQAVTWAVIALLRNLFIFGIEPLAVALQIAVIIIGLPVYLGHWLSAQKSVKESMEEKGAALRRFYLYATMAGFLGPFTANAFDLVRRLFQGNNPGQSSDYRNLLTGDAVFYHILAMIVLAALWFYHQRVVKEEAQDIPELDAAATIRRLYVMGFSAAGLTMTILTLIHLVRWIMLGFGQVVVQTGGLNVVLTNEITRLLIGVPLWLIFWIWAQRLFEGESTEERTSVLRKFYLYGAVFIGALGVVTNATIILASTFSNLLGVKTYGDIRDPLPIIIGMAVLWAYHGFVLREDAKQAGEAPRQAEVRRLHLYLIAAVGLAALLVGLSGVMSVLLRSLDTSFDLALRESFAWFTSAIIAGLPVWIIPWRKIQLDAEGDGAAGADERRSVVRKIYLYFFQLLAVITLLSSAVYIVFRILSMILGEDAPTLTELGHAISFSLIAVGLWLYHSSILRSDGALAQSERADLIEALRVVVLDVGDGTFGRSVIDELKSDNPEISLEPIVLKSGESAAESPDQDEGSIPDQLTNAGLIVGSWEMVVPGGAGGAVSPEVAQAVISSGGRKILVPFRSKGWDWSGVDPWDSESLVKQTVAAVQQVLVGEGVKSRRPMGAGSIIGIVVGVLILLGLLARSLVGFFSDVF
jgi:hypothetical protein